MRCQLRSLIRELRFVNDKVAVLDIPALEIDTSMDGLVVARGSTVLLSSLTLVAHGIEVGIKFSGDMEFAIQVDQIEIQLFRRINISGV